MRAEPNRKYLFTDEEDSKRKYEVVDNHNEDLEGDDTEYSDYYSMWEDNTDLDD